jgi:hypothetical protein
MRTPAATLPPPEREAPRGGAGRGAVAGAAGGAIIGGIAGGRSGAGTGALIGGGGGALFDGSKELICSIMDVVECGPGGKCQQVTAEDIGRPNFFKVNFKGEEISAAYVGGGKRSTGIEKFERVDGKVIIQGAEDGIEDVRDGVGRRLAIAEESGKMVLTASGDDVGFVLFGACAQPR